MTDQNFHIKVLFAFLFALFSSLTLTHCQRPQVPFAKDLFFDSQHSQIPMAKDCERCHQEIYREWESSAHAQAWRSATFQSASAQGRAKECTNCHASAPIDSTTAPSSRTLHREEGVTCITCHLSTSPDAKPLTMRGPVTRSLPVDVHPVIEDDEFYRSSELCGKCHESVYREWQTTTRNAKEPKTCQSCHMPSVRRTVESVNADVFYSPIPVALEKKQDLRKHLFAVPDSTKDELRIDTKLIQNEKQIFIEVTLQNHMPHSIPSGDFGKRELLLRLQSLDAQVPWHEEQILNRALGEKIDAQENLSFRFAIPSALNPKKLELTLKRWDRLTSAPQELRRQVVLLPDPPATPAKSPK